MTEWPFAHPIPYREALGAFAAFGTNFIDNTHGAAAKFFSKLCAKLVC